MKRAPSELLSALIAPGWPHYIHFIQQLLLPPPITNTHTYTSSHNLRLSRSQYYYNAFHFTACTTQLPKGSQFNVGLMR